LRRSGRIPFRSPWRPWPYPNGPIFLSLYTWCGALQRLRLWFCLQSIDRETAHK
jgi:hypothetical protein